MLNSIQHPPSAKGWTLKLLNWIQDQGDVHSQQIRITCTEGQSALQDGIARMGEVIFSGPDLPEIRALGLGSCIGLCAFDPVIKLACIAHIVLPHAKSPDTADFGRYADTAIPYVIRELKARGAQPARLKFAIAGGAQLFSFDGAEDRLDVGRRNSEAVKQHLSRMGLRLIAEDTGGKSGRTICLDATTGAVSVKRSGGQPVVLAVLS